jgi:hypothetical protein
MKVKTNFTDDLKYLRLYSNSKKTTTENRYGHKLTTIRYFLNGLLVGECWKTDGKIIDVFAIETD